MRTKLAHRIHSRVLLGATARCISYELCTNGPLRTFVRPEAKVGFDENSHWVAKVSDKKKIDAEPRNV